MPQFDYPLILAALIEKRARAQDRDFDRYRTAWHVLRRNETTAERVLEHYGLADADPVAFLHRVLEEGPFAGKGWIRTGAARGCAQYLAGSLPARSEISCAFDGALPVAVELALAGFCAEFECESGPESELFRLTAGLAEVCGPGKINLRPLKGTFANLPSFIALEYNGRSTADAAPAGFGSLSEILSAFMSERTLVYTSSTLLWQATRDAELLREELVQKKLLAAVVKLPFALSSSPVYGSALLVLNKGNVAGSVRFLDYSDVKVRAGESNAWEIPFDKVKTDGTEAAGSGEDEPESDPRRIGLFLADALYYMRKQSKQNQTAGQSVSFKKLAENGNLLDMKRYGSRTANMITALLAPVDGVRKALPLSEIADISRALMITDDGRGPAYKEVMQGDIDKFGFICEPKKQIRTETDLGNRRARQATLRPRDIILAVRGAAGMVGYALAPSEYTIAGQQFVIIRPKKAFAESFPPSFLFRYLRSAFIQDYLKSRNLGEKLPRLKMGDIESIPVIKPSQEALREDQARFERQIEAREQILKLEQTIRGNELDSMIFDVSGDDGLPRF